VDWKAACELDSRYQAFLDHILLRFVNSKAQRTHFPIILVTDHTFFFTYEMFFMARLAQTDFFLVDTDLFGNQLLQKKDRANHMGNRAQ